MKKQQDFAALQRQTRARKRARNIVVYALLTLWGVVVLFPFYWMILTSVKSYGAYNSEYIPKFFTLSPTLQATDLSTGTLMSVSLHSDALQCPDRPHPAQADDRTTRTLTLVGVICSTMPSLLTALTDLGDELADVVKPILNTKAIDSLPIY